MITKNTIIIHTLFLALTACQNPKNSPSFTDGAIYRDEKVLQDTFLRIEKFGKLKNTTLEQYHLAKSDAWAELARDEFQLNNRLEIVEEALTQSHQLLEGLEQQKQLSLETPITKTSQKERADLWEKTQQWKKGAYFKCYIKPLAELEVQLVAIGHQIKNFGLRHAKPYILKAERLDNEIAIADNNCRIQTERQKIEQDNLALAQKQAEELKTFDEVAVAVAPVDLKDFLENQNKDNSNNSNSNNNTQKK